MSLAEEILMAVEDAPSEGIILFDPMRLQYYKVYVDNGKLTMSQLTGESYDAEYIIMRDQSREEFYHLTVEEGKLKLDMVSSYDPDALFDVITLKDNTTGAYYELYVNDTKLTLAEVDETEVPDDTLTIDVNTRQIRIPAGITCLGVESDDDVNKVKWLMPRYYQDHDLSTFKIRINYENAKGEGDVYEVKNPVVGLDTIRFTWEVDRHAFKAQGIVKFNACLIKLATDGVIIEKEFNTTPAELPVLEGLETSQSIVEDYPDIIEQFRREQEQQIEDGLDEYFRNNDIATDERLFLAFDKYFEKNPIEVTDEQVSAAVQTWMDNNEPTTSQIADAVADYMAENPVNLDDVNEKIDDVDERVDRLSNSVDAVKTDIKSNVSMFTDYYPAWGGCVTKTWDGVVPSITKPTGSVAAQGMCVSGSANVTWTLTYLSSSDAGLILTISGNGPMDNYNSQSDQPWYNYRDSIVGIVIEDGVTAIGARAFFGLRNISNPVVIPGSVRAIFKYSFYLCDVKDYIFIGDTGPAIDYMYAFRSIDNLKFVNKPGSVGDLTNGVDCDFNAVPTAYFNVGSDFTSILEVADTCHGGSFKDHILWFEAENRGYHLIHVNNDGTEAIYTATLPNGDIKVIHVTADDIVSSLVVVSNDALESRVDVLMKSIANLVGHTPGIKYEAGTHVCRWPEGQLHYGGGQVYAYGRLLDVSETTLTLPDGIVNDVYYGLVIRSNTDFTTSAEFEICSIKDGTIYDSNDSPLPRSVNTFTKWLVRLFKVDGGGLSVTDTTNYVGTLHCPISQEIYLEK